MNLGGILVRFSARCWMVFFFFVDWGVSFSFLVDVLCSGVVGVVEGWAFVSVFGRREDRVERTGRVRGARFFERTGRFGGCFGCFKEFEDVSLFLGFMVGSGLFVLGWFCSFERVRRLVFRWELASRFNGCRSFVFRVYLVFFRRRIN